VDQQFSWLLCGAGAILPKENKMGVISRGKGKVTSIALQISALERVVNVDFACCNAGKVDVEEMPGCCSTDVVFGFTSDRRIKEYIENILNDYELDKEEDDPAVSKEAATKAVHNLFLSVLKEEGTDERVTALTLADTQSIVQELAVEAGFEAAYKYPGKDGMITVYFREN
jgi:hypothetical protein